MERRILKVLHVFSGFGGGISSLVLNLVENKAEDFCFDTLAFSYKGGERFVDLIEECGGSCYTMPRPRKNGYRTLVNYVDNLMASQKYDAIHCHIAGWMCYPFKKVARKHGVKTFVIHAHTTLYDSRIDRTAIVNKINKKINYKYASHYMICSDMAGEYIFGRRYMNKKYTKLIPNGMKENKFSDIIQEHEIASYNAEFDVPDGAIVISHVGRFSFLKNHDYILEIAKRFKQKKIKCVFLLIGDGERYYEIKKKVESLQLSEEIRFLGRRNDISKLMQYSDCMILPSLNEGLPTVAIECQAAGTPMIIADTITSQCDMGLDLIEFLSLELVDTWVDEIVEKCKMHRPISECIDRIRKNGFTAEVVGKLYCDTMRSCILKMEMDK